MSYKPRIPAEFPDVEGIFLSPRHRAQPGDWHIFKNGAWWSARRVGTNELLNTRTFDELIEGLGREQASV